MLLMAANANAADGYVGIDFQSNALGVSTKAVALTFTPVDKDYYGLQSQNFPSIYLGANLTENLAIEGSYSYISTDKTNNNTGLILVSNNASIISNSKIKIHNIGLDLKPQISFNDLKIFAIFGMNILDATLSERLYATGFDSNVKQQYTTGLGYSIGTGVEYKFIKNLSLRAQVKYTKTNLTFDNSYALASIDNILAVSAGLKYSF